MNTFILIRKMIRHNMKIIFAGKFIWFFLGALGFLIFLMIQGVLNGETLNNESIFGLFYMPAILLIFYPTVYGIQHDADTRILEIIFGIPNYRYKVWLVRLIMVFVLNYLILIIFGVLVYFLIYPINPFQIAGQMMFLVLFIGGLAFMLSTTIKNGNGTAVVLVVMGVGLIFLSASLERTMWNLFLNPFDSPRGLNEVVWKAIVFKNRLLLSISALVFVVYGLFNLQKREKFT